MAVELTVILVLRDLAAAEEALVDLERSGYDIAETEVEEV